MEDLINARCGWAGTDELYLKYHDEEWGQPVTDDRTLFEFLVLCLLYTSSHRKKMKRILLFSLLSTLLLTSCMAVQVVGSVAAVSYTHLDVYKRQKLVSGVYLSSLSNAFNDVSCNKSFASSRSVVSL